jgi:hypothetical protein
MKNLFQFLKGWQTFLLYHVMWDRNSLPRGTASDQSASEAKIGRAIVCSAE